MRLIILFITASVFLFPSCTIQKRTFRKGYYISWNKSGPKEKSGSEEQVSRKKSEPLAESIPSKDTLIVSKEDPKPAEDLAAAEKPDSVQTTDSLLTTENQPANKPLKRYSEKALMERLSEVVESIKEKRAPDEVSETGSSKQVNLFALNAFPFAIGYVILIFYALDHNGLNWPIALAVLCLFLAISFAVIGIVKWKRDKDRFWGTFFALMALILLVSGTFALLVVFMAGGF